MPSYPPLCRAGLQDTFYSANLMRALYNKVNAQLHDLVPAAPAIITTEYVMMNMNENMNNAPTLADRALFSLDRKRTRILDHQQQAAFDNAVQSTLKRARNAAGRSRPDASPVLLRKWADVRRRSEELVDVALLRLHITKDVSAEDSAKGIVTI